MVGEEARVLDLLLGPAKFEEVVWRIETLLHLHVPFHHNAMEGPVDRPHTLHLLVQLQRSEHLAAKGGGDQIVVDKRVSVVVDVAERLLLLHEGCLRVATHKPHDDGAFLHRARFLQAVADTSMWTPMSLAMAITTSLVFSPAVSGTPCRSTFSRRLYCARRSSSNACDCRAERRWPTSLVRRSFSAAMLASSWGSIASMAVATAALMVLSNRGAISTITALTMSRTATPVVEMGGASAVAARTGVPVLDAAVAGAAPVRFRVWRGFGRLDWVTLTTGASAVRLAETAWAIDLASDWAISRKMQFNNEKSSDVWAIIQAMPGNSNNTSTFGKCTHVT